MTEQNQRFHPDDQHIQPLVLTPSHKLIKRKLCQLQNKAFFFEGQLNPLVGENQKLKAQLTSLNKSVIASTDLLRSLLPIGSSESKKLKLELANLNEISEMIKEDWYLMEDEIQRKNFAIDVLQKKIASNKQQYQQQFETFRNQTDSLLKEKNETIQNLEVIKSQLQTGLQSTRQKCNKQISDMKDFFKSKVQRVEQLEKQMYLYNRQVQAKYRDYEKFIQRMKIQISSNLAQFQESKKNLREIYEKLMSQKLQEQAEGFNSLLRSKEEEKQRLISYYEEKELQMQRYLNEKSDTIQQLKQHQIKQKQQLEKSLQQISEYRKMMKQMEQNAEEKEKQITQLKNNSELLIERIKNAQLSYLQNQRQYQERLNELTRNRSTLEQQLNTKITNLQKQKSQLSQQLNEQSQKLKQTEKSLATAERRFSRQLEDQKQKWQVEKHLLQEKHQELHLLINEKQNLLQQHEQSISQLQLKHSQQLRLQQQTLTKQILDMKNSYQQQLTVLKSQTSQQFAWLKKENERILSEERIKSNQEMQTFQQELNLKLRLKEEEFSSIKANLHEQIMQTMMNLKQRELEIQQLQLNKSQTLKQMEDMKTQHQSQVKKMQQESQKALKQLQKQCEQQKKKIQMQMVNQLMEFQAEMEKKSQQYESHLQKIQTEMMNEINMLKSSNALEEMQAKYLSQITSLKKQHQQQLITMQEKQKQSQQSLIQQQKRRIQQLILQYEQDMTRLAKKLQSDIQNLNTQLFQQQKDHQITKMTREEKIKYLSKKINELKIISEQKENNILELQLEIQGYKKEQAKMKQIIEEKVNERKAELEVQKNQFMRECQVSIDKNRLEAQRKVAEVQRDRLQHSQAMFDKFNQLKQLHQEELQRLQKRYSELEKLFAQRPSRAQDLSKIKQLIEIKSKMDLEIKTYHKKVEHANEIVKYLNLELENYKDTYDMFGPNDQPTEKPLVMESSVCESPIQSIMKLKRFNHKINTEGSQSMGYSSQHKYETVVTPKITNNLRMSNDSPSIKEFQLYPGSKLNQSHTLIPPETTHEKKMAYNRRSPQMIVNNRIKKASSIDKSGEIVLNAENFLKLISGDSRNAPAIRENKSHDRRAYRKSKPRRLNTLGMSNGDVYSLVRRQSIDQDSPVK